MVYKIRMVREVVSDAASVPVRTPRNVYDYAMEHCYKSEDMWRESAWMLLVNRSGEIFGHFELGKGGTSECTVETKMVAKVAIESMAAAVILVHNHPSNNCVPSQVDIKKTADVKRALKVFDITLLDHVIIGDGRYYSFNDERTVGVN